MTERTYVCLMFDLVEELGFDGTYAFLMFDLVEELGFDGRNVCFSYVRSC